MERPRYAQYPSLWYVASIVAVLSLMQCSPKTTQVVSDETKVETAPTDESEKNLSPCAKFSDNKNGEELLETYVIYRDFIKLNQFDESFHMWEQVYNNAPAADGKRWTVYSDGIAYYQHFLQHETDQVKRKQYRQKILTLYDEIGQCYPEQATYVKARKAFDLYYEYPEEADDSTKYYMMKEVVDELGLETYVFVLNPFTKMMADRYIREEISIEEAQHYAELIPRIIDENLAKGKELKSWYTVRDYAIPYLERLEAVKGFYDCAYYMDKYLPQYALDPTNCELATEIYSKLRFGGCSNEDSTLVALNKSLLENKCIEQQVSSTSSTTSEAYAALKDGNYTTAVKLFEAAANETNDPMRKSQLLFIVSKIYYSHLKNFSKSRLLALAAAEFRPNWGEPYLLIGKLYASSGPLCGPGTGFDSQVVTWPAIDKWEYAKSIDPSVAAEANSLIQKYAQYMPSGEDLFFRSLTKGSKFKVECWIQEVTTIRTSD